MLEKENEWPIGEDGLPTRKAARVVLIDESERVLLIRGHDADDPTHEWWFTVGGGLEPGETPKQGAVREAFEETGLRLDPSELVGPLIYRDSKFFFADRTRRQMEHFFLARVQHFDLDYSRWSKDERGVLDEMRWFTVSEAKELRTKAKVFPDLLPDLIEKWLTRGTDGDCVKIDEYNE
ncbi:MAG: NUDIX domain-containing protein [Actinomycetaceae bacterium]|nr:NUDIX domain-containing protein [Actinomycetaceae bacterium]